MISAIQIAGFLNQVFPKSELIKEPPLLHIDTNSEKLKVD